MNDTGVVLVTKATYNFHFIPPETVRSEKIISREADLQYQRDLQALESCSACSCSGPMYELDSELGIVVLGMVRQYWRSRTVITEPDGAPITKTNL